MLAVIIIAVAVFIIYVFYVVITTSNERTTYNHDSHFETFQSADISDTIYDGIVGNAGLEVQEKLLDEFFEVVSHFDFLDNATRESLVKEVVSESDERHLIIQYPNEVAYVVAKSRGILNASDRCGDPIPAGDILYNFQNIKTVQSLSFEERSSQLLLLVKYFDEMVHERFPLVHAICIDRRRFKQYDGIAVEVDKISKPSYYTNFYAWDVGADYYKRRYLYTDKIENMENLRAIQAKKELGYDQ